MNRQYLYAVQFKNGIVKLGRASNVAMRIKSLKTQNTSSMEVAWCIECDWFAVHKLEQMLLTWAKKQSTLHRGHEYFSGLCYPAALNRMRQINRSFGLIKVDCHRISRYARYRKTQA